MATTITSECINCGACEPECPNTAIYQGGVPWELNGVTHPPLAQDVFYIVPEKCTECVGFHDHEACAAVCPVDVCIPDPNRPETEEVLIARSKQLHPEMEFPADFPSRFRKGTGPAAAPAPAAEARVEAKPETKGEAIPPPTPAPAATPSPPKPAVAPSPAPQAASARPEKPVAGPKATPAAKPAPAARAEKKFPSELPMSFEAAAALVRSGTGETRPQLKWLLALAQPVLGALPFAQKQALEKAVGDRRFFTAAGATGLNALHNMLLYPVIAAVIGAVVFGREVFSEHLNWFVFLGMVLAAVESIWRMREGFQGRPVEEIVYRGALYGLPLAPLAGPMVKRLKPHEAQGRVGQDGFRTTQFDEKIERERRYGEVYRLHQESNGFLIEFEFPRRVPQSAIKEELGVPDEMPDYDYELALQNGYFIVKGKVADATLRKVAAVSPAFPPDFTTNIQLPSRVAGFRHRFRDKTLEVALPKRV